MSPDQLDGLPRRKPEEISTKESWGDSVVFCRVHRKVAKHHKKQRGNRSIAVQALAGVMSLTGEGGGYRLTAR